MPILRAQSSCTKAVQVLTALFRCPLRAGCFILCGAFCIFPSTNTCDGGCAGCGLWEHRQGDHAGHSSGELRERPRGGEGGGTAALIQKPSSKEGQAFTRSQSRGGQEQRGGDKECAVRRCCRWGSRGTPQKEWVRQRCHLSSWEPEIWGVVNAGPL